MNKRTFLFHRLLHIVAPLAFLTIGLTGCSTSIPIPPMSPKVEGSAAGQPAPSKLESKKGPSMATPAALPRSFMRPARGPVTSLFNGNANKGIDISGKLGDPVLASRAGRVVLVSSALASYGTMIVLKHDDEFISAYAHIERALVKEGEEVGQGQPIAEMGRSGTDHVELHFEIRKMGIAVDPIPYLEGRKG